MSVDVGLLTMRTWLQPVSFSSELSVLLEAFCTVRVQHVPVVTREYTNNSPRKGEKGAVVLLLCVGSHHKATSRVDLCFGHASSSKI